MCRFDPPPGPFLAGPQQAPTEWIILIGMLLLLAVAGAGIVRGWGRARLLSVRRRVQVLAIFMCPSLLLLTGWTLLGLVFLPSADAVSRWGYAQRFALEANHCTLRPLRDLDVVWEQARHGSLELWREVGFALMLVGFGMALLSPVWMFWLARRWSAQASQQ